MSIIYKIKLASSRMKFASGHFTIFSKTERERIHGHNFTLSCTISSTTKQNDLVFDYANYKNILANKCQQLDELMLLPELSPYLTIKKTTNSILCDFNGDEMIFPLKDIYLLPIENITIEGLAEWFLNAFINTISTNELNNLNEIEVAISSSPSQVGVAIWNKLILNNC